MATLDRPTAPGISQWYPVIYLRPQEPERRLWPPNYGGPDNPAACSHGRRDHAIGREPSARLDRTAGA